MACQPDTPPAVYTSSSTRSTSSAPCRPPQRPEAFSHLSASHVLAHLQPVLMRSPRPSSSLRASRPCTVIHPPSTLSEHGTHDCINIEPVRDRNAPPSSGAKGPPSPRHRLPGQSGDEFRPSHANTSEGPSMEGVEERRAASQGCLPTRRRPKPVPIDVSVQYLLMCLITACTEPASAAHRHGHYLKLIEALERYRVPRIEFAYDSALAVQ